MSTWIHIETGILTMTSFVLCVRPVRINLVLSGMLFNATICFQNDCVQLTQCCLVLLPIDYVAGTLLRSIISKPQ